ncbi:MAG TPA: sigma-70 family RNA polymerase sigma factor [Nocardioidaceae bacterium]|nr:sigma-70 family RNA polymerase sigma factor [Nocardioidaceae bacterium]
MHRVDESARVGLAALRLAVLQAAGVPAVATSVGMLATASAPARLSGLLMAEALGEAPTGEPLRAGHHGDHPRGDHRPPCGDDPEASRMMGLVDLARGGDSEAFGLLYDHYNGTVYRFLYYRVGAHALAEDLTSETFFRALRSMASFKWQGRDFGAWLITIARNLVADHFKAGRTRLEMATDDLSDHDTTTPGPEDDVLAGLTNEALLRGLRELAAEQQECLVLRFLQGMSIAETAQVLERSEGAVKQLQLRAVRNLAKLLPEGIR